MTDHLRVGVVGCGEIAQIAHLPLLSTLPQFELTAVCDTSSSLLEQIGERFRVSRLHIAADEMIAAGGIDAVAVLNMDHTAVTLMALEARLPVFVEKPLAFTVAECREIAAAAHRARVPILVGYMRQHDPLYQALRTEIAVLGSPRIVRVRDAAGDFSLHGRVHDLLERPDDDGSRAWRRAEIDRKLAAEVGEAATPLYEGMLMLCSHDVAMLRGLFDSPHEILACAPIGLEGLICLLDHGSGQTSLFEGDIGAPLAGWDQTISVRGDNRALELQLGNPYLSQVPTTLQFHGPPDLDGATIGIRSAVADPFRRQWHHFQALVEGREAALATCSDAALDVELLAELTRLALPAPAPEVA